MKIRKEDALEYHKMGRKGKIAIALTKPCATQRDLSLAYSPGVAEPCREIEKDINTVFDYTAKGNLVAVISNGTAVLGLGDIGPEAGKPVMEGKGVLFKTFADIDVFDIELRTKDIDEVIRTCEILEPTFGGINLEDIKGPDCFYIEEALKKKLKIPVFHDDQHGTAIISGAALLNASTLTGKKLEDMKVVYNGAGASGIACAKFHISLGIRPENVLMCDSRGVIYKGREKGMNVFKEDFAVETDRRTLEDALVDADAFVGLSQGDCVTAEMVKTMAKDPIIFALANPDPEIPYDVAKQARPDAIIATGRSDFPNQVNNVLGFPFIFRGALDVQATGINEEMKQAAAYALAELAKEEVPESVRKAYGSEKISFGKDYIIPKPFDQRVLTWVSPAVAQAAMDTGVAQKPIEDMEEYKTQLSLRMGRTEQVMVRMYQKARRKPKSIVLPEGEHLRIIQAASRAAEMGIAKPILVGNEDVIRKIAQETENSLEGVEIVNPQNYAKIDEFVNEYYRLRQRKGVVLTEAQKRMKTRPNYFAAMMVHLGYADTLLSGYASTYKDTITPMLEIVGRDPMYDKIAGVFIVRAKNKLYFLADCTLTENPDAQELADIALATAKFAQRFEVVPRVAMLSYSNFGSAESETSEKIHQAIKLVRKKNPTLVIDGEVHADVALDREILRAQFPFSTLKEAANVLVFPDLNSANISYKLLKTLGDAQVQGPYLVGFTKRIHIAPFGEDLNTLIDMIAMTSANAK